MGVEARLVKGAGGVFEVRLDGELLFSKKKAGRFPDPGEIEGAIASRTAGTAVPDGR
jgi:selenoprotein W-related protein